MASPISPASPCPETHCLQSTSEIQSKPEIYNFWFQSVSEKCLHSHGFYNNSVNNGMQPFCEPWIGWEGLLGYVSCKKAWGAEQHSTTRERTAGWEQHEQSVWVFFLPWPSDRKVLASPCCGFPLSPEYILRAWTSEAVIIFILIFCRVN